MLYEAFILTFSFELVSKPIQELEAGIYRKRINKYVDNNLQLPKKINQNHQRLKQPNLKQPL